MEKFNMVEHFNFLFGEEGGGVESNKVALF